MLPPLFLVAAPLALFPAFVVTQDASTGAGGLSGGTGLEDPIPAPIEPSLIKVSVETLATGLVAPIYGTGDPVGLGRLFVVDQAGGLVALDLDTGAKKVFLDLSSRLVSLGVGGPGTYDERGFLGVAFHPDYTTNGKLYTYTSEPVSGTADFTTIPGGGANHQSVILEWEVTDPTNPSSVVDTGSLRELLRIDQPSFNHNGGCLAFGPDDLLYIGLGDGGGSDDQGFGHSARGNGQDTSNILGSLLRIDPDGTNSANGSYGIPFDNPFVGVSGVDEIYAYGFRNPYRFSFDPTSGMPIVADVGQNDIEEVDLVTAGGNYGWNHKEGSFFFDANGVLPGFVTLMDPGVPPGLIDPLAEYDHDEGIAVIGGFVYTGSDAPLLTGHYVFADYFPIELELFHVTPGGALKELEILDQNGLDVFPLGFGQDAAGEIYLLASETGIPFGTTGVVLRITGARSINGPPIRHAPRPLRAWEAGSVGSSHTPSRAQ